MGVIKKEDIIAWRDGHKIICADCGEPGGAEPLTEDHFEEDDHVTCDECGAKIF